MLEINKVSPSYKNGPEGQKLNLDVTTHPLMILSSRSDLIKHINNHHHQPSPSSNLPGHGRPGHRLSIWTGPVNQVRGFLERNVVQYYSY